MTIFPYSVNNEYIFKLTVFFSFSLLMEKLLEIKNVLNKILNINQMRNKTCFKKKWHYLFTKLSNIFTRKIDFRIY